MSKLIGEPYILADAVCGALDHCDRMMLTGFADVNDDGKFVFYSSCATCKALSYTIWKKIEHHLEEEVDVPDVKDIKNRLLAEVVSILSNKADEFRTSTAPIYSNNHDAEIWAYGYRHAMHEAAQTVNRKRFEFTGKRNRDIGDIDV